MLQVLIFLSLFLLLSLPILPAIFFYFSAIFLAVSLLAPPPHLNNARKYLPNFNNLLSEHPNIRLFISQCGQQSIDEAIAAAVPVLGLPMAAEQWRNAEQLLRHQLGTAVNLDNVDDEEFKNIIERTMRNET